MQIEQRKREEIEEKYKWDLTTIYKTDEEFLSDLENLQTNIENIKKYESIMMKNAQNLYDCLQEDIKINSNINKLYLYAHCKHDQDTSNSKYQKYYGKLTNLISEYEKASSFIIPEEISTKQRGGKSEHHQLFPLAFPISIFKAS